MFFCSPSTAGTTPPTKAQLTGSVGYWYGLSFFFGDIEKAYPSDGFNCLFTWHYNGSGFGMVSPASPPYSPYTYLARNLSGVAGARSCGLYVPPPHGGNAFGGSGPAYSAASGLIAGQITINDGADSSIRGWLDRVLVPCQPRPLENFEVITVNGVQYVAVMWAGHYYLAHVCQILIRMEA